MTAQLLPIIDSIEHLGDEQLNAIKNTGFCFFKIEPSLLSLLERLIKVGIEFFKTPEVEKQLFTMGADFEGYIDHKIKGNLDIERYAYRGGHLPKIFSPSQPEMDIVKSYFVNKIALPIIKKIFNDVNISQFYENSVKDYSSTLSFIYYPYDPKPKFDRKLKAHKDFVLLTVLFITKSGLEVCVDDHWYAIDPKPGYVVVNVANTLELMTGHIYKSSLHRVHPPTNEDRLSISTFLGPNPNIPICNYKTGEQLHPNFKSFLDEQIKIVYPGTFDE